MIPQLYDAFPQYFGTQPGTSGPVYVGAFCAFPLHLRSFRGKRHNEVGIVGSYNIIRSPIMGT